jgi:putative membrane protein
MSAILTSLRRQVTQIDRAVLLLIVAWVLAMISLPIVRWTLGDEALPAGITVGVLLQIAAVFAVGIHAWGFRRTLRAFAVVVVLAWAFEFIGHMTGFPFGEYDYTERLQPQIGGVPVLIPLAWLMMLPPSWALAWRIARRYAGWRRRAVFVGAAALAMTAWDLFLDPQMVGWSLWVWQDTGGFTYFGIPWINFAGWLLASGTITAVVTLTPLAPVRLDADPAPSDLFPPVLIVIYIITWLLEAIGQIVFWELPATGVVGTLGMGAVLWWGLRSASRPDDGL